MQQIKIFKGVESDLADLESRVNAWLKQSGARVLNMFGNIAPQSYSSAAQHGHGGGSVGLGKSFAPSDVLVVIVHEAQD